MDVKFEKSFLQRSTDGLIKAHRKMLNIFREMQFKTTMSTISHPLGWLSSKWRIISVGKEVEKLELSYKADRSVK